MDLLLLALVLGGISIGVVIAILPMGPVTVLTIRRGLLGDYGGALRLGLGRAPAEGFYCALAVFGVAALLEQAPGARLALRTLGSVVFLAVGTWLVLQEPKLASSLEGEGASEVVGEDDPGEARRRRFGNWAGFIIAMLNPALIMSWSAGVGIALSMMESRPGLIHKAAFPLSLALGLALGYVVLVGLLRRFGAQVGPRGVRAIFVIMGSLFISLAAWNGLELLGIT